MIVMSFVGNAAKRRSEVCCGMWKRMWFKK
jgi:hypothetical protein